MDALQFEKASGRLTLKKLPVPELDKETDVIVKVAYAGICGTDLHILAQDGYPCGEGPLVLGHEFSGRVERVGPAVRHVKPGDRVSVDPQSWCNTCCNCTSGRYHLCEGNRPLGIFTDGCWAEYVRAEARQVYLLPDTVPLKQGALCEPLSCVAWGWERAGPLPVGREVAVAGAGIIGNLWASLLHHRGHRRVTLLEPNQARRRIAAAHGCARECLSPEEGETKAKGGWTADLVVDCSGSGPALQAALALLAPGGTLAVFGVAPAATRLSVSPYEIFKKELTIVGVVINPFCFEKAIGLIEAMGTRYLSFDKLGIREFGLKDYQTALDALKRGEIAKGMFCIDPSLE